MEQAREKPITAEEQLRDREELEGTLLLPTAEPVSSTNGGSAILADTTVATAVPATHFEYTNANTTVIEEVPVIPTFTAGATAHNPERDRQMLAHGERMGRIHAEQEKEKIQKANRDTLAKDYYTKAEIERANQEAAWQKYKEDAGLTQTSATAPKLPDTYEGPPPMAPQFYEGTYGADYEVSEYETGTYDTTDYEVSKYKSVYEKR